MSEKLSPFEVADCINEKRSELVADEVGYDPYMMNRIFANIKDTVLFANEMNMRWGNLTKQQQLDFYYHALPKKKRYGKWHKSTDDRESLSLIQEAFGFSKRKAKDALMLLKPALPLIQQELEKGGRNGNVKQSQAKGSPGGDD